MEFSENGLFSAGHIGVTEALLYFLGNCTAVNCDNPTEVVLCGNSI